MLVTIHQPDFLPWLGFFDRWRRSDLLILLDDVQFLRRGWHHRDRIKTETGPAWLTVPTEKKGRYHQRISEVMIASHSPWRRKHLGTVQRSYAPAPYFVPVFAELSAIYERNPATLMALNRLLLDWAAERLAIDTPVCLASEFSVSGRKSERLMALCRAVGADGYLSGLGARAYLEEAVFEAVGIGVVWHQFEHPVYPQLHGTFIPMLSVLDYLMMTGGDGAEKR